jgi:oxygen-independent coproporphyrinogen-3 oxidase
MTALRTDTGIDVTKLSFHQTQLLQAAARFIDTGHLLLGENRLRLSKEGKLLADGIASALFADE